MRRKPLCKTIVASFISLILTSAYAATTVPMYMIDAKGQGKSIGSIKIEDSLCGVLITPDLHDLPPGLHGFHVHQKPSCGDRGMAAGDHLDPDETGEHNGPYRKLGHLGDLPVLVVDQAGNATIPTLAPRFKLSKLNGHSIIIHEEGDNYADSPKKLGGGGPRIACGIIGEGAL
ncbi:MAG: superoxide dismutase family protein [Gammaproteobacteria bacterium]|nr:superoxide dismutase family protein [Gammaproteobacteria bacterium]